jgi:hypothetical protein
MSDKAKSDKVTGEAAVEKWNRAVREAYAGDDPSDASSVLEASDEEVERQLREAGVDLDAEAAAADATYEAMLAKHFPHAANKTSSNSETDVDPPSEAAWVATTESNVVAMPKRSARSAWVVWLIAAALATAGAAYVAGHRSEPPPPPPPEEPKEEPKKEEPPTTVTPQPAPPAPVTPAREPDKAPPRPNPKGPH